MFRVRTSGSFRNLERFLDKSQRMNFQRKLESHARRGVEALASATPQDSGQTAASWNYRVRQNRSGVSIEWTNSNVNQGFPVAVMLQYGYGTGTGGYVQGRDYINPAIRPVFDRIAEDIWREVTSA